MGKIFRGHISNCKYGLKPLERNMLGRTFQKYINQSYQLLEENKSVQLTYYHIFIVRKYFAKL